MDGSGYYIGLDLGRTSVGWAVTDEKNELLRAKGKDMWGVRLFDEADTAEERRIFRKNRRKRQREVLRIRELKKLFSEEIGKKDPGFFLRLEESVFWTEDRSEGNRQSSALFAGDDYTDVDFYREYPTMFHLRRKLAVSEEIQDIRLLYLGLLHMFKHRGYFGGTEASLETFLGEYRFPCEKKVAAYEKHREDLEKLKRVVRGCGQTAYDEMFRVMKDGLANYSAYAGSVNSGGVKSRRNDPSGKMKSESKSKERFYKYVVKVLAPGKQEEEVQEILGEIKKGTFLPRLYGKENGVIPNWFYVNEMKEILKNASGHFWFLNQKDKGGRTVADRILNLFTFHIPYFIGPLGDVYSGKKGYHVWVKRKEPGKVYPWNLEEKVDMKETAERFVKSEIRKCAYISGEPVLPKHSLMYQKYQVLNELNGIRVNGEKLPVQVKQALYAELYSAGETVERKQVEEFLVKSGLIADGAKDGISGLEVPERASLSTVGKFSEVLGDAVFCAADDEMIEKIVFWMAVMKKDDRYLEQWIREEYGALGSGRLNDCQIQQILRFSMYGWGNFSERFLKKEILTALWETQETLAELLAEPSPYLERVEKMADLSGQPLREWCGEDFKEEFSHPFYRRMVWQAYRILKEITEIKHGMPEKIYLTFNGKKGQEETGKGDFLETGRGAAHIVRIFRQAFPDTEIIFLKEGVINVFRKKNYLPSFSFINDYCYAGDAYLCAVLGKANEPFFSGEMTWQEKAEKAKEKLASVSVIKRNLKKTTPIVTKKCFLGKGGVQNKDTIRCAKLANEESYLPVKRINGRVLEVTRYGGRTCINNMCYTLVEYQVGKKTIRSMEALPVCLGDAEKLTEEKIEEYLLPKIKQEYKKKEVINFRICVKVIKYRSLLKINGYFYYLGGKTGYRLSLENAVQWKVDEKQKRYLRRIFRAVKNDFFGEQRKNGEMVLTREKNRELYQYILEKMNTSIYRNRTNFTGDFLKGNKEKFEMLDLPEQCRFFVSAVESFQSGARKMDLHLLGGSPNSGVMFLNKKISECSEVLLIQQSVTGLYSRVTNLLKV